MIFIISAMIILLALWFYREKLALFQLWFLSFLLSLLPVSAYADWTPLVTSDMFTGIQTDVMTVAGGIISVILIIIGLSFLVKAMVK